MNTIYAITLSVVAATEAHRTPQTQQVCSNASQSTLPASSLVLITTRTQYLCVIHQVSAPGLQPPCAPQRSPAAEEIPLNALKLQTGSFRESCMAAPTKAQLPHPSAGSRRKVWKVAHKLASAACPAAVPPWARSSKS